MLKRIFTIVVIILSIIFFQSCNNDDVSNTAKVQLKLIDLPGDYLEVNVNIVDVQYNNSEDEQGWRSFESFEGEQIVDLTELVGGVNLVLSNEIIQAGTLKQIRLVLGDGNTIMVDGEEGLLPLETPSAQQSGLKLNLNTELEAGFSYTFILDWDVQKSIVKTGYNKYILKPVIRVEAEAKTGKLEGIVIGDKINDTVESAVPLEGVLVKLFEADALEGDEAYATTTTTAEGYFIFEGLPTIDYKVEIEQEGYATYESEDIDVTVNVTANLGTIELVVLQ
jgi:hypothetical protein